MNSMDHEWGGGEISARTLLGNAVRHWPWLAGMVAASLVLSVVIVRTMTPAYEATTTLIENDDVGNTGASILGSLGEGLLQASGMTAEMEEVLSSRRLAERVAAREDMQPVIQKAFPAAKAGGIANFIRGVIYGVPTPGEVSSVDKLQTSLTANIDVDQSGKIMHVSYAHPDRSIARQVLVAALSEAQYLVAARKREQAAANVAYLTSLLKDRADQTQAAVIAQQLLPSAIAKATLLSNPDARVFSVADGPYVSASPAKPRVGLIAAVCIALAIAGWVALVAIRSATR